MIINSSFLIHAGYDSVQGIPGGDFMDDELVVYRATQQSLEYLVELKGLRRSPAVPRKVVFVLFLCCYYLPVCNH